MYLPGLEDCQIFQKGYDTDNDYDYLSNLFHFAIKRKHINQIKNKENNQNCYQKTNEDGHRQSDLPGTAVFKLFGRPFRRDS